MYPPNPGTLDITGLSEGSKAENQICSPHQFSPKSRVCFCVYSFRVSKGDFQKFENRTSGSLKNELLAWSGGRVSAVLTPFWSTKTHQKRRFLADLWSYHTLAGNEGTPSPCFQRKLLEISFGNIKKYPNALVLQRKHRGGRFSRPPFTFR